MRILSQSGTTDLPYENIGVSINALDNQEIIAYTLNGGEYDFWKMARYSTDEKAQKALEMLHGAYCGKIYLNHGDYEVEDIDLSQKLEKKIKEEMLKPHFLGIKPSNPVVECKYFKFPTDEEIEVLQ